MKTVRVGKRTINIDEPPDPKKSKIVTWAIENWKILLPVFATITCAIIAAGVSLFIHFNNKTKSEASQKQGASPQQVGTETAQKLIVHNQPTSLRKAKPTTTKNKPSEAVSQEPASRKYARQQIERWRKEIQSFANRGGGFDRREFMKSTTYTEMYPFLSANVMKELNKTEITLVVGGPQGMIDTPALMALYEDLDRIAAK